MTRCEVLDMYYAAIGGVCEIYIPLSIDLLIHLSFPVQ